MTCNTAERRFRLLDWLVGWDAADTSGLEGLEDATGVRLALLSGSELTEDILGRVLPPRRLARSCEPCTWFLITKAPPASRLLSLGPCAESFQPFAPQLTLYDAVAVAVSRAFVAVADRGAQRVWILTLAEGRIVGEARVQDPAALCFVSERELVVASAADLRISSFDPAGQPLRARFPERPPGVVERIALGADCALWLVLRSANDALTIHRASSGAPAFVGASLAELVAAFPAPMVPAPSERGFCLSRTRSNGSSQTSCWNWQGRLLDNARAGLCAASAGLYAAQGQLLSRAIDSGVARCRWHRVRIDADVPEETTLEIAVSTSEHASPAPQGGVQPGPWTSFPSGVPHPDDWQVVSGPNDFLILQPPGRYLFVRMRLSGPGTATPHVRRVHLDIPRATSANLLPSIYREEADAADFTERFLALFDAALEELDEAVQRSPALLDAQGVPDKLLPWIERMLGMAVDLGLAADKRRALLAAAPRLFRRRGTRAALLEAIQLATGLEASIEEPGLARAWGAAGARGQAPSQGSARLDRVRLFGKGDARLRLGASRLGRAQLRSFGNPDLDPHQAGAFQITVGVPALDDESRDRIAQLIEQLVPGHVLARLVTGRADGFWLLPVVRLGVDTRLAAPPLPVLGRPALRLDRTSVLPDRGARLGSYPVLTQAPASAE